MIQAYFEPGETVTTVEDEIYQYDYNQKFVVHGLELPAVCEIDFSTTEKEGSAISVDAVTVDGVTTAMIPNSLLANDGFTSDYKIYAFIYVTDEESGETVRKVKMKVKARPKADGQDIPVDRPPFEEAVEEVRRLAETAISAKNDTDEFAKRAEEASDSAERSERGSSESASSASGSAEEALNASKQAGKYASNAHASAESANESSRNTSAMYNEIKEGLESGVFKGEKGDKGDPGENGTDGKLVGAKYDPETLTISFGGEVTERDLFDVVKRDELSGWTEIKESDTPEKLVPSGQALIDFENGIVGEYVPDMFYATVTHYPDGYYGKYYDYLMLYAYDGVNIPVESKYTTYTPWYESNGGRPSWVKMYVSGHQGGSWTVIESDITDDYEVTFKLSDDDFFTTTWGEIKNALTTVKSADSYSETLAGTFGGKGSINPVVRSDEFEDSIKEISGAMNAVSEKVNNSVTKSALSDFEKGYSEGDDGSYIAIQYKTMRFDNRGNADLLYHVYHYYIGIQDSVHVYDANDNEIEMDTYDGHYAISTAKLPKDKNAKISIVIDNPNYGTSCTCRVTDITDGIGTSPVLTRIKASNKLARQSDLDNIMKLINNLKTRLDAMN